MITNFKDMGDHYLLNGAKMWILMHLCWYRYCLGKKWRRKFTV
jgi:hypothetical protein